MSASLAQLQHAEDRLLASGIQLPPPVTPFGAYVPAVRTGNLLFLSGMLPTAGHKPAFTGRLGRELNTAQGRAAAHTAALNVLAVAKHHAGSLNKISQVVRPMIETYPLEKAAQAYARMLSGDATFRVVLTM